MLLKDEEGRFSLPCLHRQKIIIIIKVFVMQYKTVRMCSRMFKKKSKSKMLKTILKRPNIAAVILVQICTLRNME